jgi:hypothetical protein
MNQRITKEELLAEGYPSLPPYDSILQVWFNDKWDDYVTIKTLEDAGYAWSYVATPSLASNRGLSPGPYRIFVQQGAHTFTIEKSDMLPKRDPQYQLTAELLDKLANGIPLNTSDLIQLAIPIAYSSAPMSQMEPVTVLMDRVKLNGLSTVLTGAIQQLTVLEGYVTGKIVNKDPEKSAATRLAKVRKALGFNQ